MEYFNTVFNDINLYGWDLHIGYWFFLATLCLFVLELAAIAFQRNLSWNLLGDSVTNFITLYAFQLVGLAAYALFYLSGYFWLYENANVVQLPMTGWSLLGCIVVADLVYYWEHRFMHSCGLGWATHTVHHSSPYFNLSVAYRFGPLDAVFPFFFHAPLVMMGFHPFMVFLAENLVQIYQTLLHTETVKRLPKPVEAIMNTPSHHRVHHGTNSAYIDKNYAGIFIVWDKMFGTFAEEKEKVRYGVFPRLNSVNPFKVFFEGIAKLSVRLWQAPSWTYRLQLLIEPPLWVWQQEQVRKND